MTHLKTAHPSVVAKSADNSETLSPSLDKFTVTRRPPTGKTCSVAKAETITELLVNWVTKDMRRWPA